MASNGRRATSEDCLSSSTTSLFSPSFKDSLSFRNASCSFSIVEMRISQYSFLLKVLGLRNVKVHHFSILPFICNHESSHMITFRLLDLSILRLLNSSTPQPGQSSRCRSFHLTPSLQLTSQHILHDSLYIGFATSHHSRAAIELRLPPSELLMWRLPEMSLP